MKLSESGVTRVTRKPAAPRKPVRVPADLTATLARNAAAATAFKEFRPSARREYVEWITEAKTSATRVRRLAIALEWIAEGKHRNWKYEKR